MTWSPFLTLVTPAPTSTTMPAPSWPRIAGKRPSGSAPDSVNSSVWQMPVALISTSTSPALGPSRSTSMISSGFPAATATAARVFMIAMFPVDPAMRQFQDSALAINRIAVAALILLNAPVARRLLRRGHARQSRAWRSPASRQRSSSITLGLIARHPCHRAPDLAPAHGWAALSQHSGDADGRDGHLRRS